MQTGKRSPNWVWWHAVITTVRAIAQTGDPRDRPAQVMSVAGLVWASPCQPGRPSTEA